MPEISHQQAAALAALDWLFSDEHDDRRTGRSYILALAYLRWAVERADRNGLVAREWVTVADHFLGPATNAQRIVLTYLEEIARAAGILVEVDRNGRSFRLVSADAGHWVFARQFLRDQFVESDIDVGPSEQERARWEEQRVAPPRSPSPRIRRGRDGEPTLRERVIKCVEEHPGQTATQIAKAVGHINDTVASILYKEVQTGGMTRRQGGGPRGGFTYFMPEQVTGPSIWERLRTNPYAGVDPLHGDDEGSSGGSGDPHEVRPGGIVRRTA